MAEQKQCPKSSPHKAHDWRSVADGTTQRCLGIPETLLGVPDSP